ncbi:MAG TPA: hypothetical protein VFW07_18255 [Parafilimonas sp.]|nr:hypothetical protein [Parafilimonas sp.]
MRKLLLATNAAEVKASAIDFGCYIANLTQSPLTGIFIENRKNREIVDTPVASWDEAYEVVSDKEIHENESLFLNRCLHNEARHSIHHVQGDPLHEMVKESLYADIILTDGNTSFAEYDGWPSKFVKELLENAKCPLIITPFEFDEINEVVFTYDGTDSSIFAIKQFIYLLPEFKDVKITLLQVLKDEGDDITEQEKLKGFLMMHYNAVHYGILSGDAETELFKKFLAQRNKILVMGAYGRKKIFNRSTADILLKTLDIPIFITHH